MRPQQRLDELARLVDRAAWGLSAEPSAAAVSAEHHALAAVDALCAVDAHCDGRALDLATDPRADLSTAARLLDQLPAAVAEQPALLAAAAHIRQANRTLAD